LDLNEVVIQRAAVILFLCSHHASCAEMGLLCAFREHPLLGAAVKAAFLSYRKSVSCEASAEKWMYTSRAG